RLPNNPGSQKLTPPSSARPLRGAETMVASASTATAIGRIDRAVFLASETVLPFIVAPRLKSSTSRYPNGAVGRFVDVVIEKRRVGDQNLYDCDRKNTSSSDWL